MHSLKGLKRKDDGLECHKDQAPQKELLIYNEQMGIESSKSCLIWVGVRRLQTHIHCPQRDSFLLFKTFKLMGL